MAERSLDRGHSRSVFRLVRQMCPKAPRIGSTQRIFLGVKGDGKNATYTIVRGAEDKARECQVVGYRIELGLACSYRPANKQSTWLIVKVALVKPCRLISRVTEAGVSCLECVPAE
jgi:hypothetical protein